MRSSSASTYAGINTASYPFWRSERKGVWAVAKTNPFSPFHILAEQIVPFDSITPKPVLCGAEYSSLLSTQDAYVGLLHQTPQEHLCPECWERLKALGRMEELAV